MPARFGRPETAVRRRENSRSAAPYRTGQYTNKNMPIFILNLHRTLKSKKRFIAQTTPTK